MLLYGLACLLERQRLSFDVTALTLVTVLTFCLSSFGGLRIANYQIGCFYFRNMNDDDDDDDDDDDTM